MAILNINGADYSGNVKVGTYKVNSSDVFSSWTDANGIEHRRIIREKVSGSFDLQFRNMNEYDSFVRNIESAEDEAGYVPCYLFVNNKNKKKSCQMYISYKPSLDRQCGIRNYVPLFSCEVTER